MVRCDQCQHWKAPEHDFDEGFGKCGAVEQRETIKDRPFVGEGKRRRDEFHDWDEVERLEVEAMEAAKARVVDGSAYYAALETRADFGCVLFKAKSDG